MNLTNIKKSIKNIFLWHLTIRWAILLITTGLFVLILYPSLFMTQPSYNLGDIASRNIKAPRDFFIEDEMATEIHRQQEIENVPTVYDHDTALLSHRRSQVHQAFESIRSVWKKMENNPNSDILMMGLFDTRS